MLEIRVHQAVNELTLGEADAQLPSQPFDHLFRVPDGPVLVLAVGFREGLIVRAVCVG